MSPRRWFRVSRAVLDAGEPFALPLFEDRISDPVEGPETARTDSAVTTLVRGLDVPLARGSDPTSSHAAAARVRPANGYLVKSVRRVVGLSSEPMSAFDIASALLMAMPNRWDESTIRSAVSRAGLRCVDVEGRSPRGQRCCRYTVPDNWNAS